MKIISGGSMRGFGFFLVVVGIIWALVAFNMNTTITTESETIGSGEYAISVPSQTVHNLGLLEERKNHLMFSGLTILAGIILIGFGSVGRNYANDDASKSCPFCAEKIKYAAVKCRFCGSEFVDTHQENMVNHVDLTEPNGRLKELLDRIKDGNVSYETYVDAISAAGGTIDSKGFLHSHYLITLGNRDFRVDNFEDLQHWFIQNLKSGNYWSA